MSSQHSTPVRSQSEIAETAVSAARTFCQSDAVHLDDQSTRARKIPSSRSAPGHGGVLHGTIQADPNLKPSYPISTRTHHSVLLPINAPLLGTSFQREATFQREDTWLRMSQSAPGRRGALHGPIQADYAVTSASPQSKRHGRPSFAPMDLESLKASIKKEGSWLSRRHSPRQGTPQRAKIANDLIMSLPSHGFIPDDDDNSAGQNECCKFANEVDDFEISSDEEEPSSCLLGFSTPSTLRKRRHRMSLPAVHEAEDENLGCKSPSRKENNLESIV